VLVIGVAAAAEHIDLREPPPQVGVLGAERRRVALVELFRKRARLLFA
jgi:hypothetical protein